jgi:N-acetylglucosaminyl-diphospho-decaprenol L-rhamnosyltransferase
VTIGQGPHTGPDGSTSPDVSVVIVSYNTRTLLDGCLRSVLASTGVLVETWVVDNASLDGSADHVAADFPAVRLIRNAANRGFAAANNLALAAATGRYLLLLNPDTVVRPDTVARLAGFLDQHPAVGITGPRVLNTDGSTQSCGYRYPTLAREIAASRDGRRAAGSRRSEPAADLDAPLDVDWVDGCCLMIRRSVIDRIGPLDEQFFLYAEELDWCRTAAAVGIRIATCPAAEMTHFGGQSTTQVKGQSLAMFIETRLRYYHKHDGLPTAAMVAAMYALGCVRHRRGEPDKSRAKLLGIQRWWQGRGPTVAPAGAIQIGNPAAGVRRA